MCVKAAYVCARRPCGAACAREPFMRPAMLAGLAPSQERDMIRRMICGAVVATTLALAALPPPGRAQRLYKKERDEQAQKALELAEPLKNGELFEKQLKNLSALSKRDIETEFLALKSTVVTDALDVTTWGGAHEYVCRVQRTNTGDGLLPSAGEIKSASDELTAAIAAAKDSLKAFQDEVKANEVTIDPSLA